MFEAEPQDSILRQSDLVELQLIATKSERTVLARLRNLPPPRDLRKSLFSERNLALIITCFGLANALFVNWLVQAVFGPANEFRWSPSGYDLLVTGLTLIALLAPVCTALLSHGAEKSVYWSNRAFRASDRASVLAYVFRDISDHLDLDLDELIDRYDHIPEDDEEHHFVAGLKR